jgi:5-(carboxyamino)imidazole ribonucleotide mutase
MPNGVPVATVALNAAQNAGILAAQMLATGDPSLLKKIIGFKNNLKEKVLMAADEMEKSKKVVVSKPTKKVAAKKRK